VGDWELLYLAFVALLFAESLAWRRKGEIFFNRSPWGSWGLSFNPLAFKPLLMRIALLRMPASPGQNFQRKEFVARLSKAKGALWHWRWLAGLLAFWIYLALPYIYLRWPAPSVLGGGMLVMLLLWQATAFSLWRAKRRLASEAKVLPAFLTPISALRGSDMLTMNLAAGFHALPVAQVLLKPKDFEALALLAWRSHKMGWHKSQLWPQEQLQGQAWIAWLAKQGMNLEQALAEPEMQAGAQAWCPRCLAQYREKNQLCADCGLNLKPYR